MKRFFLDSFCKSYGAFAVSTGKDSVWYRNFYRRRLALMIGVAVVDKQTMNGVTTNEKENFR